MRQDECECLNGYGYADGVEYDDGMSIRSIEQEFWRHEICSERTAAVGSSKRIAGSARRQKRGNCYCMLSMKYGDSRSEVVCKASFRTGSCANHPRTLRNKDSFASFWTFVAHAGEKNSCGETYACS